MTQAELPAAFTIQEVSPRFIVASGDPRATRFGAGSPHGLLVVDRAHSGGSAATGTLLTFPQPALFWLALEDAVVTSSGTAFYRYDPVSGDGVWLPKSPRSSIPLYHSLGPDRKTLAYVTKHAEANRVVDLLFVFNLRDGSWRELGVDLGSYGVAWMDDERLLVVGNRAVFEVDVSTGVATPFDVGVDFDRFRLSDPVWDPDRGRWLFRAEPRFEDDGDHPRIVDHAGTVVWDDARLAGVRCCECGPCIGNTKSGTIAWRDPDSGVVREATLPGGTRANVTPVVLDVVGDTEAIVATASGVFSLTLNADNGIDVSTILLR